MERLKPRGTVLTFEHAHNTRFIYFSSWSTHLTSPAVCPEETAFSYCFLAFSFSFTSPMYTWPSISLRGTKMQNIVMQLQETTLTVLLRKIWQRKQGLTLSHTNSHDASGNVEIRVETDWHAEVADEGGLGQLYFEEDFLRFVRFVQSLGGHDGVGETRRHGAVHRHAVHLHLREMNQCEICYFISDRIVFCSWVLSIVRCPAWLVPKKTVTAWKNVEKDIMSVPPLWECCDETDWVSAWVLCTGIVWESENYTLLQSLQFSLFRSLFPLISNFSNPHRSFSMLLYTLHIVSSLLSSIIMHLSTH